MEKCIWQKHIVEEKQRDDCPYDEELEGIPANETQYKLSNFYCPLCQAERKICELQEIKIHLRQIAGD